MKTPDEFLATFKEIAKGVDARVDVDGATPQTKLTQLGLDSIAMMEVLGALEEKLKLNFSDEDLQDLVTLGDLLKLVQMQTTD